MMTYEELLKAWRAEREAEGLAKLPEDFYKRVAELISALRASLRWPTRERSRRASPRPSLRTC